jgi:hypothetical protein
MTYGIAVSLYLLGTASFVYAALKLVQFRRRYEALLMRTQQAQQDAIAARERWDTAHADFLRRVASGRVLVTCDDGSTGRIQVEPEGDDGVRLVIVVDEAPTVTH